MHWVSTPSLKSISSTFEAFQRLIFVKYLDYQSHYIKRGTRRCGYRLARVVVVSISVGVCCTVTVFMPF